MAPGARSGQISSALMLRDVTPNTTPIADEALQNGTAYPNHENWGYPPGAIDPSCGNLDWAYSNSIPGVTVTLNPTQTSLSGRTVVSFSKLPLGTPVRAYNQTITPTCTNPDATGTLPSPANYTIAAVILDIGQVDQKGTATTTVTDKIITPITGQSIEVKPQPQPNVTLDHTQWTIPGDTVKTYTQTKANASFANLSANDLIQEKVNFYWIHDTPTLSDLILDAVFPVLNAHCDPTQCSGQEAYWGLAKAKTTPNVLTVHVGSMTSVTGAVGVGREPSLNCLLGLHFGHFNTGSACDYGTDVPGIHWKFKGTAPFGGAGELDGTQVIKSSESATGFPPPAPSPAPVFPGTGGVFALDTCIHYGTNGNTHEPIGSGATATYESDDTPGTSLSYTWKTFTRSDSFILYFVYKPNDEAGALANRQNIWVGLGHLDWSWSGKATNSGTPTSPVFEPSLPVEFRNPSWLHRPPPGTIPYAGHPNWSLTTSAHTTNPSGAAAREALPTWTNGTSSTGVVTCPPGG